MKKSKKLLSVVLALTMAFSAVAATFAVSAASEATYKPQYNETVTKEDMDYLVKDLDTIVGNMALVPYGGTILDALYGVLPQLGTAIADFGTAAFYKGIDATQFANLADPVTADSMAEYLKANKASVSSAADLTAKLDKVIDAVIAGVFSLTVDIGTGPLSIEELIPTVFIIAKPVPEKVLPAIDALVADLGVTVPTTLKDALTGGAAGTSAYLKAIIHAVLPNPVSGVLSIVRNYAKNGADILTQINNLFAGVDETLTSIGGMLAGTVDVDAIKAALASVKDVIDTLPKVDGALDLNAIVSSLLDTITLADGTALNTIVTLGGTTGKINLAEINLANLAATDSNADTLRTALHYVYENLFANKDNLAGVKALLADLGPSLGLDDGMLQTVNTVLDQFADMSEDEIVAGVADLVKDLAGRDDGQPEPPSGDDGNDGDSTDNPNTGDAAMAAIAFTGVAAAAAFVLLRKKK